MAIPEPPNSGAISIGVSADTVLSYRESAWSSPLAAAVRAAPICTPICDRLVMPRQQFERSDFYQNWVRRCDQAEGLVAALTPMRPDVIMLTLMRERGPLTRPFTEDGSLPRFTSLLPHMGRAAHMQRRLMQAQALPHDATAAALQALSVAVLLLDSRGQLLWANTTAECLLR
ncbi:MAG TPA: hypothetical protein VME41_03765, partial [Stellaceae bacterium]|nr:hypothetical protein [Stellaceae bacterium]